MLIGEINELIVLRQSDLGYMLSNGEEEILLHFKQAERELTIGETVSAFLYLDSKKRITATLQTPHIKLSQPGFVTVCDVVSDLGIFISNNTPKDPLISSDDLPTFVDKWPISGDTCFCKLKLTKTQLIAKLVTPEEAKSFLNPTRVLSKFEKVEAFVMKDGKEGVNLVTLEGHIIFVYYKHKRNDYRIGEKVSVTINNVRDNNSYNGTLLDSKVPLMKKDADVILDFLNDYDGFMPYNAKSSVELIEENFKMSKAAFKRALGNLYKQRLVEIKEDGTYLVK